MHKESSLTTIRKLRLNNRNQARLFASIPTPVRKIVKKNENVVLAGGSMRSGLEGNMPTDFDIFIKSIDGETDGYDFDNNLQGVPRTMVAICEQLQANGFKLVFSCPQYKLMTLKAGGVKVQIINRSKWFDIEELLKKFDFSVCMFATEDFKSVYTSTQAIRDVKKRRLSIGTVEYPVATLNRLHKYRNYGYHINEYSMQDLCWWIWDIMGKWEVPDGEPDFYDRLNDQMSFYID